MCQTTSPWKLGMALFTRAVIPSNQPSWLPGMRESSFLPSLLSGLPVGPHLKCLKILPLQLHVRTQAHAAALPLQSKGQSPAEGSLSVSQKSGIRVFEILGSKSEQLRDFGLRARLGLHYEIKSTAQVLAECKLKYYRIS